jgi:hypothetical protein
MIKYTGGLATNLIDEDGIPSTRLVLLRVTGCSVLTVHYRIYSLCEKKSMLEVVGPKDTLL